MTFGATSMTMPKARIRHPSTTHSSRSHSACGSRNHRMVELTSMAELNRMFAMICRNCEGLKRRRSRTTWIMMNRMFQMNVVMPKLSCGNARLNTYGTLEIGEVPRLPTVISTMPNELMATPSMKNANRATIWFIACCSFPRHGCHVDRRTPPAYHPAMRPHRPASVSASSPSASAGAEIDGACRQEAGRSGPRLVLHRSKGDGRPCAAARRAAGSPPSPTPPSPRRRPRRWTRA